MRFNDVESIRKVRCKDNKVNDAHNCKILNKVPINMQYLLGVLLSFFAWIFLIK